MSGTERQQVGVDMVQNRAQFLFGFYPAADVGVQRGLYPLVPHLLAGQCDPIDDDLESVGVEVRADRGVTQPGPAPFHGGDHRVLLAVTRLDAGEPLGLVRHLPVRGRVGERPTEQAQGGGQPE